VANRHIADIPKIFFEDNVEVGRKGILGQPPKMAFSDFG